MMGKHRLLRLLVLFRVALAHKETYTGVAPVRALAHALVHDVGVGVDVGVAVSYSLYFMCDTFCVTMKGDEIRNKVCRYVRCSRLMTGTILHVGFARV